MKCLIISDTHLGKKVDPAKLDYLLRIISEAEEVVLAGDFWDQYFTSYDDFINSGWKALFPLLLERNAIYVPGNHDYSSVEFEIPFAKAITEQHIVKNCEFEFVVRHGHMLAKTPDVLLPGVFANWVSIYFGSAFQWIGSKLFGQTFFRVFGYENRQMKLWAAENLKPNQILVAGHSHLQEDAPTEQYINTGVFKLGFAQYLWIEQDSHTLINDRYRLRLNQRPRYN